MILQLKFVGLWLMILGTAHSGFFKYFNWRDQLKPLNLLTRQIFISHTFFIAVVVFLMGVLCFFKGDLLFGNELGSILSLGLSLFWGLRLLFQHFYYSSKHWRGKGFETIIHIVFSLLWLYQTILFFLIYKQ